MEIIERKERKENSCFNYDRRLLLEGYLLGKKGYPKIQNQTKLAKIFQCDRKTIYNEIKRGLVEHLKSDLSKVLEYNADYAQQNANWENTGRGRKLKIGSDFILCSELKKLIVDKNYSPYAVIAEFNLNGWKTETRFCEKTLYNWVNKGFVAGVERTDLPNKGVKYKEKGSTRRYSRAKCAEHSIDNRPKEIETRKEFGHWELDTVKGGADKGTECLFTMTERKSRNEIARKMPDAKENSTVKTLDEIERRIGSENFRQIFKTMTCDGGSEFMDIEGIETSCIDGKPRTKLYFTHPYTACERGTNENHNKIMRRFFPKGCDFSKVTDEEVQHAEDWMNNYPRKIHDGLTPAMIYKKCCNL